MKRHGLRTQESSGDKFRSGFSRSDVNVFAVVCVSSGVGQAKIARVQIGTARTDAAALRAVYNAEFAALVRLAYLLIGDRGLAEELVQDTFARLLERPPGLVDPKKLSAYVRTSVLNATRSRLRRIGLERRHAKAQRSTEAIDDLPDVALRDALLQLPIRQRQCVALRYYDDRTIEQIATLLEIGVGSAKTHVHRGLQRLRELLEENP